jgi:hypothetical protein
LFFRFLFVWERVERYTNWIAWSRNFDHIQVSVRIAGLLLGVLEQSSRQTNSDTMHPHEACGFRFLSIPSAKIYRAMLQSKT